MATGLEILADIERNAIERLKVKGLPQVKTVEIKKEGDLKFSTPAVRNVIADGKFTPVGQISYRVDVNLYAIIIFKHMSDEESRRKGVYPILSGVVALLAGQQLGLTIDELTPVSFREITNAEDIQQGLIVFQVMFTTHFNIEKISDEEAVALLKVGLSVYSQAPADDTPEVTSVVTLPV